MTDMTQLPPIAQGPVTILDIFTKQIEILGQLSVIHEQLKAIPDHEQRIRVLETARSRIYGAAIVLGGIAGGGASWLALTIGHH